MSYYSQAETYSYSDYTQELLKIYTPPNLPYRHSLSASELFALRKTFYQNLFSSYELQENKVIIVSGTKGKGSTVEYIASGLIAAGRTVGIFTSPHLHTARERIKLNRKLISYQDFVQYSRESAVLMRDCSWAIFFDNLLTMAILFFAQHKPEYIILECGIGGKYDSTNFMDTPAVSVITSISMDHMDMLGESLEEIAWNEVGIIKPALPAFTTINQEERVKKVVIEEAKKIGANLSSVECFNRKMADTGSIPNHPFFMENACLARAVLRCLQVPDETILSSLEDFYWPCRVEPFYVDINKLDSVENSSKTAEISTNSRKQLIVLDGCHNQHSVLHFILTVKTAYPGKKLCILFGAGAGKAVDEMIQEIFIGADQVMMIKSKHFKSITEEELLSKVPAQYASKLISTPSKASLDQGQKKRQGTVHVRLPYALQCLSSDDTILAVCGSLFVAADAREVLFELDDSLFGANDWVRETDPTVL